MFRVRGDLHAEKRVSGEIWVTIVRRKVCWGSDDAIVVDPRFVHVGVAKDVQKLVACQDVKYIIWLFWQCKVEDRHVAQAAAGGDFECINHARGQVAAVTRIVVNKGGIKILAAAVRSLRSQSSRTEHCQCSR